MMNKRETLLPAGFENKYHSEELKNKIADFGMWQLIPAVTGDIDSSQGIQRLQENDLLFTFIDQYFPDAPYAFEPNMQDGRFMFLPDYVGHQGIGICASLDLPGFLEIGHFWYPGEFTEKEISIGMAQVYVPIFSTKPGSELADMVQKVYMNDDIRTLHCTFSFHTDQIITLKGNFLDHLPQSIKKIRDALKDSDNMIRRNGEGLIEFMQNIMK